MNVPAASPLRRLLARLGLFRWREVGRRCQWVVVERVDTGERELRVLGLAYTRAWRGGWCPRFDPYTGEDAPRPGRPAPMRPAGERGR